MRINISVVLKGSKGLVAPLEMFQKCGGQFLVDKTVGAGLCWY